MNMVIDRPEPVVMFVIFYYFLVSLFVKSTFLATQEELEALLWICFTPGIVLLIFEEKIVENYVLQKNQKHFTSRETYPKQSF